MSFTDKIKNYILFDCKMDAVGIAPASAFDAEEPNHRPDYILPGCKSVIVFAKRIPTGVIQAAFRKVEDGNENAGGIYNTYGRELMPNMNIFFMQFNIAQFIERTFGYTAVPCPSGPMQNVTPGNVPMPAFVGSKRIEYLIHSERAAYAAGLGDIAWNNMLVTKENGPRQTVGIILTNMELEYDEPYSGEKLCDPEKCGICAKLCPTCAIPASGGEKETYSVAGKTVEVAKINANACAVASMAFRKEFSGKFNAPDQIMTNDPTDDEIKAAYKTKPISHYTLDHYPKHFCGNKCMIYCPLGNWEENFGKTGLSRFDGKELSK